MPVAAHPIRLATGSWLEFEMRAQYPNNLNRTWRTADYQTYMVKSIVNPRDNVRVPAQAKPETSMAESRYHHHGSTSVKFRSENSRDV